MIVEYMTVYLCILYPVPVQYYNQHCYHLAVTEHYTSCKVYRHCHDCQQSLACPPAPLVYTVFPMSWG